MAIDILNAVEKTIGKFTENNENALEGKDEIVGVLGNAVVIIKIDNADIKIDVIPDFVHVAENLDIYEEE